MDAGDTNGQIVISFPELSPAEASILAKELLQNLMLVAASAGQIRLARSSGDAQDLGSILVIAAGSGVGAGLIELAKDAGKEIVKGALNRAGQKVLDAIWPVLRKWDALAKVETPSGDPVILGEEFSRPAPPRSRADAETLSDLKTLGLVILGASTFPYYPASRELDNIAFKRSAELAKKVLSPAHTIFRKVEVLDLFDQELRPDQVIDHIENHVKKHPDMRDLVLYYCGHGDFLGDREKTYYLVLKGTKPENEEYTGLGVKQFGTVAKKRGLLRRRCLFILDCCFAGEAVSAMQAPGLNSLIKKQLRDLPSQGLALLMASSRDLPAMGKGGYEGGTMFSGALAEVLEGKTSGFKQLSLIELCEALEECIKDRHDSESVIPECHAPPNILRIPMFLAGSPGLARSSIRLSPQTGALFERDDGRPASQDEPVSTPPFTLSDLQIAAQEWAKIETSNVIADLKHFAKLFPGYYSELALKRIALLEQEADQAFKAAHYAREGRIKVLDARIVHGRPAAGSTPARVWANGSRTLRLAQRWW